MLAIALVVFGLPKVGAAEGRQLRVCADPDNLPFSNARQEGLENKIVQMVAAEINATVRYTWMPQRRGFIRQTLQAKVCDLVMGVPSTLESVLPTKPYYRSTYVFVYRKDLGLHIESFDDPALRRLRIGLHLIGNDGANPPPAYALARRGMSGNVIGFKMQEEGFDEDPQGRIIEAVAAGTIDVAIVWGPFAGYFSRQQSVELTIVPVTPPADLPRFPFTYDIAMAVRHGDAAWKSELDSILELKQDEIRRILADYGVPLINRDQAGPERLDQE